MNQEIVEDEKEGGDLPESDLGEPSGEEQGESDEDSIIELVDVVERGDVPASDGESDGLGDLTNDTIPDSGLLLDDDQELSDDLSLELDKILEKEFSEGLEDDLSVALEGLETSPEGEVESEGLADSLEADASLGVAAVAGMGVTGEPSGETTFDTASEEIADAETHAAGEELMSPALAEEVSYESPLGTPEEVAPATVSEERIEEIVRTVVEEVVERVARETMASVAEKVIREAIASLRESLDLPTQ
jgi:hypothetical protein